jgi:type I site-specific restriction endonuclease
LDKRELTERDIRTKFILPAVRRAGWDEMVQVREEVFFTKGRIIVRGKLATRGKAKKAGVLCDRLEASLTATRRRLLDALLAEAVAPADDRELEAAE